MPARQAQRGIGLWGGLVLWSVIGGSAFILLSVPQDWALPISALVVLLLTAAGLVLLLMNVATIVYFTFLIVGGGVAVREALKKIF